MTSLDDIAETLKEKRTYQNEMKVENRNGISAFWIRKR